MFVWSIAGPGFEAGRTRGSGTHLCTSGTAEEKEGQYWSGRRSCTVLDAGQEEPKPACQSVAVTRPRLQRSVQPLVLVLHQPIPGGTHRPPHSLPSLGIDEDHDLPLDADQLRPSRRPIPTAEDRRQVLPERQHLGRQRLRYRMHPCHRADGPVDVVLDHADTAATLAPVTSWASRTKI